MTFSRNAHRHGDALASYYFGLVAVLGCLHILWHLPYLPLGLCLVVGFAE
jgi:hypothetical protein